MKRVTCLREKLTCPRGNSKSHHFQFRNEKKTSFELKFNTKLISANRFSLFQPDLVDKYCQLEVVCIEHTLMRPAMPARFSESLGKAQKKGQ